MEAFGEFEAFGGGGGVAFGFVYLYISILVDQRVSVGLSSECKL